MRDAGLLDALSTWAIEVLGLLPYSSNYTFLARLVRGPDVHHAIYKPRRGETPLWDFPHGTLAGREVAAYEVATALGWDLVPPTVLRPDGPLGEGSLQLFVEHDPERHYFVLVEERREDFRRLAAFDALIGNADRKSGHVLEDPGGRLWAVDHGVSFHVENKLRTVIWEFAGEPLGEEIVAALRGLLEQLRPRTELSERLGELLARGEVEALGGRARGLLEDGVFPSPTSPRSLPWPLV